jgi:CPA2 family monovalent cation:H+ antiporter-2
VSFALGAFFAGMVLAESQLSTQAAKETLPLRDAFAVLFFVSVGMLFNPGILLSQPLALLATVAIIVGVKAAAGFYLVKMLGHGRDMALTIAASLAQIGEFSFILITMGTKLDIVPPEARDLVVAGAMISILANPLLFHLLDRREARKAEAAAAKPADSGTESEVRSPDPAAASAVLPSTPPPAG